MGDFYDKNMEKAIKNTIREIPNWPKKGVSFKDITPLLQDKKIFRAVINEMTRPYIGKKIDKIVGIDARGFIFAAAMAYKLGAGLAIVRKKGKLPAETEKEEYALEYGTDTIEIHKDAINKGDRVLIIDDLLATGGTALASAALIEKLSGKVVEMAFIVDLPDVGGSKKLLDKGYKIFFLTDFEGD